MQPGFVVWFTGIPASGKTTLAQAVLSRLEQRGVPAVLLDSDELRHNLWPDLGYSSDDRHENVRRIAWLAGRLSRRGVNILIAAVAPMREQRAQARQCCARFMEVWVRASLETAKGRDPKGLYARAERGEIADISGWHLPYEEPEAPGAVVSTETTPPDVGADLVVARMELLGFLPEAEEQSPYTDEEEQEVGRRLSDLGYV
jgi:adenylyl-sulfate kinase